MKHLLVFEKSLPFFKQIRKPKLNNIEIIAISLTAKYMNIDSECQIFRVINDTPLENKIERSNFNRRKRRLLPCLEDLRKNIVAKMNIDKGYFIVDSMPLEICKMARRHRSNLCREGGNAPPDVGWSAAQKSYFYGYKLHTLCNWQGVIYSIDISPASVHDIHYLKDVKEQLSDCVLLADKGYISTRQRIDLFTEVNIRLQTPMRSNQQDYRKADFVFQKTRKRIETLFSQLCGQFIIRRNYAKTLNGFGVRICTKILSFTFIQFLNKTVFDRNLNNIKANLC